MAHYGGERVVIGGILAGVAALAALVTVFYARETVREAAHSRR
jgi:hypothetical protein